MDIMGAATTDRCGGRPEGADMCHADTAAPRNVADLTLLQVDAAVRKRV
jgi:hypothetical protein